MSILHKIGSVAIVCLAGLLLPIQVSAEPIVPIRSWQFHELDVDYVTHALTETAKYDINTVVYSHGMIGAVSDLYKSKDRSDKLRKLAREAHSRDLKVWIWIHELENDVPKKYLDGKTVQMDRPGFWDWLTAKYDKLFVDYPEFDGIMLTFHETKYKLFDKKDVNSSLSMPERFTKLINTIDDVCSKYNKDFVVRSFLYEPQEMKWFEDGVKNIHPRVMLQSKCVPHDWEPYYPNNPMIGMFPNRKLIVEFDCSSEFTGKNRVPYTSPDYFERRWRYDLAQPGVVGYNARLDHGGYDALYTPNEINIYTLYRLTQDPAVTARDIWHEWTEKRYGSKAAPFVEKALRPSFDVINKSFFTLEFWITKHSAVPSFSYATSHLSSRTIAKWRPGEPYYRKMELQLNHPTPVLLEQILAEKDQAIAMADQSLFWLNKAKPILQPYQYDDLYWRLELMRRVATVWKLHAEAFYGYRTLQEGHNVPGLYQRVQRAIQGLYEQAKVSETAGIIKTPPASASEIRKAADELDSKLHKTSPF